MKKIALAIFGSSLALALVFFTSIFFLVRSPDFQRRIIERVERGFQDQVTLGSFDTSFFPPISLIVHDVAVKTQLEGSSLFIEAPQLKLYLKLWPLFFRRIEVGFIHVREARGSIHWERSQGKPGPKVDFSGWRVDLGEIVQGKPVHFAMEGDLAAPPSRARLEGRLGLDWSEKGPELKSLKSEIHLEEIQVAPWTPLVAPKAAMRVTGGVFSWDGTLDVSPAELALKGSGSLRRWVYALSSTPDKVSSPRDLSFDLLVTSNLVTKQWRVESFNLKSPYGDFSVRGNLGSGVQGAPVDVELASNNVQLDRLSELLVPFDKAIPNKFGFSGELALSLFLKGDRKALSIAGSADLEASLLSYAGTFTKPVGFPLKLQFDWMLKGARKLAGNFNVWLKEMSLKGTLLDLDLRTGNGEITFLTNKFSLDGWETVFPPLAQSPMHGSAKLLINGRGPLADPEQLRYTATLTLENVEADFEGLPLRDGNAILELTNERASSGRLDVLAQRSPVHIEYVRNVFPQPSLSFKLIAPEFYPREMVVPLRAILPRWLGSDGTRLEAQLEETLAKCLPEGEPLRNLSLSASAIGRLLSIQEVYLSVYQGLVRGAGEMDLNVSDPHYQIGIQVEKLALGPLMTQLAGSPLLEGDFYLLGNFEGDRFQGTEPLNRLRGRGEFKVVAGAINSFDLVASLSRAAPYAALASLGGRGRTEFSDLRSAFVVQDGKVITDQVTMISPHFSATANGFFSLDGVLNYQVQLTLTELLSEKVAEPATQGLVTLPLQLYGDFSNPKIGLDSSALGQAVGKWVGDRLRGKKSAPATSPAAQQDGAQTIEDAGLAILNTFFSQKGQKSQTSKTSEPKQ